MQGRNLDYGHSKSDAREGKMAKTTLLIKLFKFKYWFLNFC